MGELVVQVLGAKALAAQGLDEAVVTLDRQNMAPILREAGIAFPEAKRRKTFEVDGVFVLAQDSTGQIIGYLEICPDWECTEDLFVSSIQIVHEHRKGRVLGRLLAKALGVLHERPFRCLKTTVQKNNHAALKLYQRLGFSVAAGPAGEKSLRLSATRTILETSLAKRLMARAPADRDAS